MVKFPNIALAALTLTLSMGASAQEVRLFGQLNLGGKPLLDRVCPRLTTGLLRGTIGNVSQACWTEKPFNHNGERSGFITLPHTETLPTWAEQARISATYVGQNLGYLQLDFDSKRRMEALKSVAERFGNPSYADREHGTGWSHPDIEIQVICAEDHCYAVFKSAEYRKKEAQEAEAKAKAAPPRARTP